MAILRTQRARRVPDEQLAIAVRREELLLLVTLSTWSLLSVVGGGLLWWRARRSSRAAGPLLVGLGRQTLGWGLVDALIAARGWTGRRATRPDPGDAEGARRRARRLALLTGGNAVLDVGYVMAGTAVAVRSARRRGDGSAVVLQGLFLLWLDMRHASRFLRHVRAHWGRDTADRP